MASGRAGRGSSPMRCNDLWPRHAAPPVRSSEGFKHQQSGAHKYEQQQANYCFSLKKTGLCLLLLAAFTSACVKAVHRKQHHAASAPEGSAAADLKSVKQQRHSRRGSGLTDRRDVRKIPS